jgi:hypothetical protein
VHRLVTACDPSSLSSCSASATTALLFLGVFLTRNRDANLKTWLAHGCNVDTTVILMAVSSTEVESQTDRGNS